jgi:hypothetical protein
MALEAERLSIGLARGVHLCCVINCIYHVEGLPFTPDLLKRFSPKLSSNSSPKSSLPFPPRRLYFDHRVLHHHRLGPLALPQLPVVARWRWGWSRTTSTQLVRATRSGTQRSGGSLGLSTAWWCADPPPPPPAWGVPDILPGFERVTPNPARVGGSTLSPAKLKVRWLGFAYSSWWFFAFESDDVE